MVPTEDQLPTPPQPYGDQLVLLGDFQGDAFNLFSLEGNLLSSQQLPRFQDESTEAMEKGAKWLERLGPGPQQRRPHCLLALQSLQHFKGPDTSPTLLLICALF